MSKYVMPCLGDYDGDSYACVDGCLCPEECFMLIPVAALPEFLSHPDLQVQQLAKAELERATKLLYGSWTRQVHLREQRKKSVK